MLKTPSEFPIDVEAGRRIDRRGFLRFAFVTAGAVAATEWSVTSLDGPLSATASPPLAVPRLAPGEAREVRLAGSERSALVARLDATSVVAFDRRCPHLGCPVVWSKAAGRFECPCHKAAFDARTGRVLYGPPRRGLEPIAVEVRGADVWLRPDRPA